MKLAEALTAAMAAEGVRDEDIAVRIGVSAQTVMKWRTGRSEPRINAYDALRRHLQGFADRIDNGAAA